MSDPDQQNHSMYGSLNVSDDPTLSRQARYLLALYLLAESRKLLQGAWRAWRALHNG